MRTFTRDLRFLEYFLKARYPYPQPHRVKDRLVRFQETFSDLAKPDWQPELDDWNKGYYRDLQHLSFFFGFVIREIGEQFA